MLGEKMAVATITATDLNRAVDFYIDKLGLKAMYKGEMNASMGAGKGTAIQIYVKPNSISDNTVVTFLLEDIEAEMEELRQKGVKFEEYNIPEMGIVTKNGVATWQDGTKGAWFKDTEGNILSLVEMKM